MDLPSILPSNLKDVKEAESDVALYEKLLGSTERLVRFFSYAADDETWAERHVEFFKLTLNLLTRQFAENRLGEAYAATIVKAIHDHYQILGAVLPRSVNIQVGSKKIAANVLVLACMSPYFKRLLNHEEGKNVRDITLPEMDPVLAQFALHYLESGFLDDLWKFEKKEVKMLLEMTERWGITFLKQECEQVLCRYITADQVQRQLVFAYSKERKVLLKKCIEVFNEKFPATIVSSPINASLYFEFINFGETAFIAFNALKGVITHLVFNGKMPLDEKFINVVLDSPKLVGLKVSGTEEWSPFFLQIPSQVYELDLSECSWLGDLEIRLLAGAIPQMRVLSLAQNTQLTYRGLSELKKFYQLKSLDLSRCSLENETLNLILQGSLSLSELNLYGCRKLSDEAFYEIGRKAIQVERLNVSRTQITDGGLLDIGIKCRGLQDLEIDHCLNITEAGIDDFLRKSKDLRRLSIKENRLEEDSVQAWKKQYPSLHIERD